MPLPFLEPGKSPDPVSLGRPVQATVSTSLVMQAKEMVEEMRGFHHQQDCQAQEVEKTEE